MPALVSSQFSPQLLHQLQTFRKEQFLCDCRLVVSKRGKESVLEESDESLDFLAHRLILSAGSRFFWNVFEERRHEQMTTVNLNNCSPDCLEVVLHFLYSGELNLGRCSPQTVLNVAKVLQIHALEQIISPMTVGGSDVPGTPTSSNGSGIGSKRKIAEEPSLFRKLCQKHSLLSCAYCGGSGSDISAPYAPPLEDAQAQLQMALMATQQFPHMLPHFASAQTATPKSDARPQASASPFASAEETIAAQRPNYYGPVLPTRPDHNRSTIFPTMTALPPTPLFSPPTTIRHTNGLEASPKRKKETTSQGVRTLSPPEKSPTDETLMVPSSDKEGWCRNKKYILKVANGFKCTVCNKVYGRYNSVSYHVTIYHRNPPIKCDEVGCQFTTREARYIHFHKYYRHATPLPKSIDLAPRSCPFCRHVAKSPAMLEKHINRHMPEGSRVGVAGKGFKCKECAAELASQREMLQHLELHNEEKAHQCHHCSYKGRTESNLRQHIMFKHSSDLFKRKFICDQCDYYCPTQGNLDAHKRRVHKLDIPKKDGEDSFDDDEEEEEEVGSDLSWNNDLLHSTPRSRKSSVEESETDADHGHRPSAASDDLSDSPSNLEDLPGPPPPSCASTTSTGNDPVQLTSDSLGKDSGAEEATDDLDDSHSNLASASTGYHSIVNYYGTV